MMKYALNTRVVIYKKNHDLMELAQKLDYPLGLLSDQISKLQIGAGVRYGEVNTTRIEAYTAHISALNVLLELTRKFDRTRDYDNQY